VQNLSHFEHYAPLPVGIVNTLGQRNPKIEQTHSDWMRPVGKSHLDKRTLWRVGVSEHFVRPCGTLLPVNNFKQSSSFYSEIEMAKHLRFQAELNPRNPCPVCGAETALAEVEPHPLQL
jgi:hypothetical protein